MSAESKTPPGFPDRAIVLFDGECTFCNGTVSFLLHRDARARLRFAALQSDAGQALLRRFGLSTDAPSTMVLIQGDRYFIKSSAAIRAVASLGGGWRAIMALLIVPRSIRDTAYSVFATNRYRLFGKTSTCPVPDPETRNRFLV